MTVYKFDDDVWQITLDTNDLNMTGGISYFDCDWHPDSRSQILIQNRKESALENISLVVK